MLNLKKFQEEEDTHLRKIFPLDYMIQCPEGLNMKLGWYLKERDERLLQAIEDSEDHDRNKLLDGFGHPKDCVRCLSEDANKGIVRLYENPAEMDII